MSTLDANGILRYDETDTRDKFSALLNMGQDATSDAVGADRARLTVLEQAVLLSGTTANIVAAGSGWSVGNASGRKIAGLAFISVLFTRTGAAITVPADGNVSNTMLGTLNPGWLRAVGINVSLMHDGFSGPMTSGYINASQELFLGAIAPAATIPTGSNVGFNAVYPLA